MKRLVHFFGYFLFVIFLFNGCAPSVPKQVTIGLLMHSLDKERWKNDRDYFVAEVERLGQKAVVKVADNDADKQLAQAKELLAEGVDALVVIPVDMFAAAEIANVAQARNVKVISYDRLIKNCKLDYYVSTDNVEVGSLQAKYLTTIKPVGNYALIGGAEGDNNAHLLYLGQRNVLQPLVEKGDIQIVYNVFTKSWSEEEGYKHALKLFEMGEPVDAIIAGNDALAMGVIRAMRENNIENVLLAGMDADLRNLQEIVAGRQTCTVYKPIQKLATTAADLAVKLARCEECERTFQTVSNGKMLVPTVFHNCMIVNRENLKLTVISEGYQSEQEVYK